MFEGPDSKSAPSVSTSGQHAKNIRQTNACWQVVFCFCTLHLPFHASSWLLWPLPRLFKHAGTPRPFAKHVLGPPAGAPRRPASIFICNCRLKLASGLNNQCLLWSLRGPPEAPRRPPGGPQEANKGPRWAQDGPKMGQDGPKPAPRSANTQSRWPR